MPPALRPRRRAPRVLALAAAVLALVPLAARAQTQGGAQPFLRLWGGADSATARELLALTHRLHQAIVDVDTATLGRIVAEDYALVVGPDPERTFAPRARWLANVANYRITSFSFPKADVRLVGPDVAVLTTHYLQDAIVGGVSRSGRFFLTDVWRRHGGGEWRLHARYSTWADQPPAQPVAPLRTVVLSAAERARYVGAYALGKRTVRVFEQDGSLRMTMARDSTTSVRLLPQGNHEFADESRPQVRYTFTVEGARATAMSVTTDGVPAARAVRVP
jgi:ketosteroid isomerase-like protein